MLQSSSFPVLLVLSTLVTGACSSPPQESAGNGGSGQSPVVGNTGGVSSSGAGTGGSGVAPGSGGAIGTGGFAPSGTGGLGMAGVPATSGGSAGGGVPSGAGGSAPSAGASSGGATAGGMNTSGGAPGSGGAGTGGAGGSPSTGGNMNAGGSGAGGQPGSSTVGFDNNARITLTGVRGVGTPSQQTIKLRNRGAAALTVTGLALSGPNMDLFKVTSPATFPATVAAGGDLTVTLQMTTSGGTLPAAPTDAVAKKTGSTMVTATLTATLSSGSAEASVYGLVANVNNYEATLGQILTTLGYKLNVGKAQNDWNSNGSDPKTLPGVEAGTDEVAAPRFTKAGAGNVTMTLVARFSPKGPLPYGWYSSTTGCPTGCTMVATMSNTADAQTSDKARMVNPPVGGGMTSFDPGAGPFGIWIYSDQKTMMFDSGTATNGDYNYTEGALNAPANTHRIKSYPLKDAAGTAIPDTYLLAVEEAGNGDYQDYVFVLGNVKAAP